MSTITASKHYYSRLVVTMIEIFFPMGNRKSSEGTQIVLEQVRIIMNQLRRISVMAFHSHSTST